MFESMFDIADKMPKLTDTKFGTAVDAGDIQHKRVQIDTRKWALSRMQPKKYSETAVQLAAEKPEDADSNEFLLKTIQLATL